MFSTRIYASRGVVVVVLNDVGKNNSFEERRAEGISRTTGLNSELKIKLSVISKFIIRRVTCKYISVRKLGWIYLYLSKFEIETAS